MTRIQWAMLTASAAGLTGLAIAAAGPEDKGHQKKPAPHLDTLKALAGTWTADTDGDGTRESTLEYKVTSAGHAVCETLFVGTEHEMITMYHADGKALVATHYCAAGNQPRLTCAAPEAGKPLTFTYKDCCNLASGEGYMGALTITVKDANSFAQQWSHFKNSADTAPSAVSFNWTRKK